MRTSKNASITMLGAMLSISFFSCEKIKENIRMEIPIKPAPIEFTIEGKILKSATSDVVLYETVLNTRLRTILSENKYSMEHLKALNFKEFEIKVIQPADFDVSKFVGIKLYFGKSQELVAEATKASSDKKTLTLDISQANLLKYAQNDNLPILLKGPALVGAPSVKLSLQLEFSAKVGLQ